jgi:hypothetical protein
MAALGGMEIEDRWLNIGDTPHFISDIESGIIPIMEVLKEAEEFHNREAEQRTVRHNSYRALFESGSAPS